MAQTLFGELRKILRYPVVAWSLTLREEHRLRAFENRVLRSTFGQKWDEVMGE
jgi:hypothetical protein